MIGSLHMTWETSVGVESEIAQLRRGDLNHHLAGVDLVKGEASS
jgi:hypothetical protein